MGFVLEAHRARGAQVRAAEGVGTLAAIVVAMVVILALAAATAGVVVVGMEGRGKTRAPRRLADRMIWAAQHVDTDGERLRR
jgi:hypothetical protein